MKRLSQEEIEDALSKLEGWQMDEGKLKKNYECKNFAEAFSFMMRVALIAEEMDHHPEWCNSWNKVEMVLTTHSLGAVSSLDVEFARRVDEAF